MIIEIIIILPAVLYVGYSTFKEIMKNRKINKLELELLDLTSTFSYLYLIISKFKMKDYNDSYTEEMNNKIKKHNEKQLIKNKKDFKKFEDVLFEIKGDLQDKIYNIINNK